MNNFLKTIQEGLSRVRRVWIITALVILGLVLGIASFASGAFGRAVAAITGRTTVASVNNQALITPTTSLVAGESATPTAMAPMPGMETAIPMTDMPGMAMPTSMPGNMLPPGSQDLDSLLEDMASMSQSLQGMMQQLDQKNSGAGYYPTATPVPYTVDMQAIMAELQSINQAMGPLMMRIQADLQGSPSAEELASVRAQVEQINTRVANLIFQLEAARAGTMPGMAAAPTMPAMPGMDPSQPVGGQYSHYQEMMARMDQIMQQLDMLYNHSNSVDGQQSSMPGMGNPPAVNIPIQGMPNSDPSMDEIMSKMDDLIQIMDSMMNGGSVNMPAPMPGMSTSNQGTGGTTMMDDMMMMMDNMMKMMDGMMAMPDM